MGGRAAADARRHLSNAVATTNPYRSADAADHPHLDVDLLGECVLDRVPGRLADQERGNTQELRHRHNLHIPERSEHSSESGRVYDLTERSQKRRAARDRRRLAAVRIPATGSQPRHLRRLPRGYPGQSQWFGPRAAPPGGDKSRALICPNRFASRIRGTQTTLSIRAAAICIAASASSASARASISRRALYSPAVSTHDARLSGVPTVLSSKGSGQLGAFVRADSKVPLGRGPDSPCSEIGRVRGPRRFIGAAESCCAVARIRVWKQGSTRSSANLLVRADQHRHGRRRDDWVTAPSRSTRKSKSHPWSACRTWSR